MKKTSKRLVIDASVAQASGGEDARHPTARNCRDFLQSVLTICHRAVFSRAMQEEWNKHQSAFARKWRKSMVARGKFIAVRQVERQDIRHMVESSNESERCKQATLKDCHLVEAALATDCNVISLDDSARDLFSSASGHIPELRNILWVNPSNDLQNSLSWLKNGALNDEGGTHHWQLGNVCQ
jgi:hypothetical protein